MILVPSNPHEPPIAQQGYTLIEAIGVGLLGTLVMALLTWQSEVSRERVRTNVALMLSQKKPNDIALITSDASAKTVSVNPAAHFDCIESQSGCANLPGPYSFDLYDAQGALASGHGVNYDGSLCSNDCPIDTGLTWSASCFPADANCRHPLIRVSGTFTSSKLPGAINLAHDNFQVNRSSCATTPCQGTPPLCNGRITVCLTDG